MPKFCKSKIKYNNTISDNLFYKNANVLKQFISRLIPCSQLFQRRFRRICCCSPHIAILVINILTSRIVPASSIVYILPTDGFVCLANNGSWLNENFRQNILGFRHRIHYVSTRGQKKIFVLEARTWKAMYTDSLNYNREWVRLSFRLAEWNCFV